LHSLIRGIIRDMNEPTAQTSPALHALIGAVQGLALWSLHESVDGDFWPPGASHWIWALAYFIAMAPLAWQLLPGVFERSSQRIGCALLLGLAYALLGAHAGWQNGVAGGRADYGYVFAAIVIAFVLLGLIGGWDFQSRRFDYERHFDSAWRNGLLIPLAGCVTGLVWALLWAGALLMRAIGLHGLEELLSKQLPQYLITTTTVSWVIGTGLARPSTLLALRRFVLTLIGWLLPMALVLALCWVLALPFTGLEHLFATRSAASYAFWFLALSIALLNAAVQDGSTQPPYAPRLARALAWAWLCILPIIIIGDWALARRVAQHGWTPDRVWAAFVGGMLTLYAFGYASSQLKREPWMGRVQATNWILCAVGLVAAVALLSPVADSHRISAQSQLARLQQGVVAPDQFDWASLSRMGRYGFDALSTLDKQGGVGASEARRKLRELEFGAKKRPALTGTELRARLLVLPRGHDLDTAWLEQMAAQARWRTDLCDPQPTRCLAWSKDFDGDGVDEILFVERAEQGSSVTLYVRHGSQWEAMGARHARAFGSDKRTFEQWREAIESDQVRLVKPRWPDLQIGQERIELP